jgi:lantibiotic modifying enzyme
MAISSDAVSRRTLFKTGAGVALGAACPASVPSVASLHPLADPNRLSYLDAAKEAARWIGSAAQRTKEGTYWLPEPDHPEKLTTESSQLGLYSGSSGIVLFLLELARVTGDHSYLDQAAQGADYLANQWKEQVSAKQKALIDSPLSFVSGLSSVPFALIETSKATGEQRYKKAAIEATEYIAKAAKPAASGVTWTHSSSVFSGDSGLILYLLYASAALENDAYLRLAAKAGDWLIQNADADPRGGLRWNAWKGQPIPANYHIPANAYFPNFEAGSPGPALALARLYADTKETRFLEAAKQGALHVQKLATVRGEAALVHYREPDLTDLYYLGFCHGPAGTARPFYELYKATNDAEYLKWVKRFARGVTESGIPEQQTPGFWDVTCQCCGTAAIVEFFLGVWAATRQSEYLAFAKRAGDQLISKGTNLDGKGYRWYQAWTRVQPGVTTAETGYMIGAAGIGSALLHLHTASEGRYRALLLPNNPFPANLQAKA